MKRRDVLSSLSLGLTALLIPSWANGWSGKEVTLAETKSLDILGQIISGIIPEGEQPGARSLKVHHFVQKVINDCFSPQVQATFEANITKANMMADELHQKKSFGDLTQDQKEKVYFLFEDSILSEDTAFIKLIKKLTIEGYTKSEYFLTNHRNYEMAPGYYNGCVSI